MKSPRSHVITIRASMREVLGAPLASCFEDEKMYRARISSGRGFGRECRKAGPRRRDVRRYLFVTLAAQAL